MLAVPNPDEAPNFGAAKGVDAVVEAAPNEEVLLNVEVEAVVVPNRDTGFTSFAGALAAALLANKELLAAELLVVLPPTPQPVP